MKRAILLLSGGLDSAACGLIASSQGFDIYAMSFAYGQRHSLELEAAQSVARVLNVKEHRIVHIDLAVFGGSALTSGWVDVPKGGAGFGGDDADIPVTYVPARNTIFLSYALAWSEVLSCADIFIGANYIDYSGYPDCRPEYIAAFQKMANLATVAGVSGRSMTVHTPLMSLTKAEIIKVCVSVGFDCGITHSCYDPTPSGAACAACDSCLIRKKGFEEAGIPDPTKYL